MSTSGAGPSTLATGGPRPVRRRVGRLAALAPLAALAFAPSVARAAPDPAEKAQAESIARVMNADKAGLHRCWERAAADDFRLAGQVLLRLTLRGGKPTKVEVAADGPGDPVLTACLVERARGWEFEGFGDGEAIELPLDFAAPRAQHTIRTDDAPTYKPKGGKIEAKILVDRESAGADRASLTILRVGGRTQIPLHRHTSAEIMVLLDGSGRVSGLAGGKGENVTQGDVIYAPAGTAHGFYSTAGSKHPTRLLVLYAPGGPERPFKDPAARGQGTSALTPAERATPDASAPQPVVVRAADVKPVAIAGGKGSVRMLLDEERGSGRTVYAGTIELAAGATIPEHVHTRETELLYVTAGRGTLTVGKEAFPVEEGMALHIPCGAKHSFQVDGRAPLTAIQFYVPGGPERRFKAPPAAGKAAAPAAGKAATPAAGSAAAPAVRKTTGSTPATAVPRKVKP